MIPDWLNDAVRAFGRQLNLTQLALNEQGVCGVQFENALELRMECQSGWMSLLVTVPTIGDRASACSVLACARARTREGFKIRSGFLEKEHRAFFQVRFAERETSVMVMDGAFRVLWEMALRVGRVSA